MSEGTSLRQAASDPDIFRYWDRFLPLLPEGSQTPIPLPDGAKSAVPAAMRLGMPECRRFDRCMISKIMDP